MADNPVQVIQSLGVPDKFASMVYTSALPPLMVAFIWSWESGFNENGRGDNGQSFGIGHVNVVSFLADINAGTGYFGWYDLPKMSSYESIEGWLSVPENAAAASLAYMATKYRDFRGLAEGDRQTAAVLAYRSSSEGVAFASGGDASITSPEGRARLAAWRSFRETYAEKLVQAEGFVYPSAPASLAGQVAEAAAETVKDVGEGAKSAVVYVADAVGSGVGAAVRGVVSKVPWWVPVLVLLGLVAWIISKFKGAEA
jgi:hypothetical protein